MTHPTLDGAPTARDASARCSSAHPIAVSFESCSTFQIPFPPSSYTIVEQGVLTACTAFIYTALAMNTAGTARQRRDVSRQHLRDAYKALLEQELRDSLYSRALGRSYNRLLCGSYGYIVDCQPDATPLPKRNGGRNGRVKVVVPMAK
jgi:hypothetical protein